MNTEVHASMTGLEARFEEELAQADKHYVDPDRAKFETDVSASKPSRDTKQSRRVEEAMHLGM